MADLIDRQTAIVTAVKAAIDWHKLANPQYSIAYCIGEAMRELPSAERHGKWIHDGYDFPHGVDWMHCSECGKRDVYCPATRTNFCPNCGARMDGE